MNLKIEEDTPKTAEHILVCLSAAPSNQKIVDTAAKMANVLQARFTALYVQTGTKSEALDKEKLEEHIRYAERLGAEIVMTHGENIPVQIAEYARLSNVTKIVIGQSNARRNHFFSKSALTEKLIEIVPDIDIHIIPDAVKTSSYQKHPFTWYAEKPSVKDYFLTGFIFAVCTFIGLLFQKLNFTDTNIVTIYILGVLVTSIVTDSYLCSVAGSFLSVVLFCFFLTEPRMSFQTYAVGYPVTFLITILDVTCTQLIRLLKRNITAYVVEDGILSKGKLFCGEKESTADFLTPEEQQVARWAYENRQRAGAYTHHFPQAKCLYLAIRSGDNVYGVIGIPLQKETLDSFEYSILLSVINECALSMENAQNAMEKEKNAVLAKNEQLRADLLRAISHDLRTPLCSISGNADMLLSNSDRLDEATKHQIYTDIYDDSEWLIGVVENLLSITRLNDGRLKFKFTDQLLDEVIAESLRHISRKHDDYKIVADCEELVLVRMDVRLIIQVLVNLIDNAIKYTPTGSVICIRGIKKDGKAQINVEDNGPGISEEMKPHIFEMFYAGKTTVADSHRSLGLGLALCHSIIEAHNGTLILTDHAPHGCNFIFTLPLSEVTLNE